MAVSWVEQWIRASTWETLEEYQRRYADRLLALGLGQDGSLPDWWQEPARP